MMAMHENRSYQAMQRLVTTVPAKSRVHDYSRRTVFPIWTPGGALTLTRQNKVISLFCGPGGFDQGFSDAGFETLLALDKDPSSVMTHRQNHPSAEALVFDLTDPNTVDFIWNQCQVRFLDGPPVGIIGGPPCQSFSVGNSHKREDDPRLGLPIVYARIIGALNKRYMNQIHFFVFENVLSIRHAEAYHEFKNQVRNCGFEVFEQVLDAQDFGVPQVRRRLFIVGVNRRLHRRVGHGPGRVPFLFPSPVTSPNACGDVLRSITHEPVIANSGLTPEEVNAVAGHWNHWCMEPKSNKFRSRIVDKDLNGKSYRIAEVDLTSPTLLPELSGGKSFKIIDETKPSYTVAYGHREVHIHPDGHRRLSVYEAMRLQGFPEQYRMIGTLSDQIRLVSEVVSPPVAMHLARAINRQLELFPDR